jgi:tetratricopeptide (TPR) repeat protein
MLCGQPPFYSEDKLEVMSMHTAKPVPPMRNRLLRGAKPVPSSIEKLILRGLTKKPGDRYASAEVFLAAVEEALATPDGGSTNVELIGGARRDTGSQPLVDLENNSYAITGAIEEALAISPNAKAKPAPASPQPPVVAPQAPMGKPAPVGGVSIGLPYTGPAGEPVFGLTPEQRLAQVKKPNRKPLIYGAVLIAAIAIGVAIAILTTKPKTRDKNTPAGQAAEMMDRGDFNGAITLLESKKDVIANDADAQLVLGNAYAAKGETPLSLGAYRRALGIKPEIESDRDLRANLRTYAADKDPEIVQSAFDLWAGHTEDKAAKDALTKAALNQAIDRRHAALVVLDHYKLGDAKLRIASYSLDLQDAPTCPQRSEAVGKLRAIGDPAAIPVLERAIARKGTTGAMRGKLINGCLVEDAKAAIGYLSGLKK